MIPHSLDARDAGLRLITRIRWLITGAEPRHRKRHRDAQRRPLRRRVMAGGTALRRRVMAGGTALRRRVMAGGRALRRGVTAGVRALVAVTAGAIVTLAMAACGGSTNSTATASQSPSPHKAKVAGHRAHPRPDPAKPSYPPYPSLLGAVLGSRPTQFVPAVRWRGRTAVWIARSAAGIGLLSFNQALVGLKLHSGTVDAGSIGWRLGPEVRGLERLRLVSAFNGAFKLATGAGGFLSYGRVAAPLQTGLASIVTYTDGHTDIGSWHHDVPTPGETIASVRQNLTLLIDHGAAASSVGCDSCWGATLGGVSDPARSALGITPDGRLVWVGGEHLTVAALADALLGARVVRAVELDINPEWVAGYLYGHRGGVGPLAPVPIAPGQVGVPGTFLVPYSRDFFTVVGR